MMKRTTIFAEEYMLNELKRISREENRSVAEIVREAIYRYIRENQGASKRLSFIGIGSGERKDVAEKHEELLWRTNSK